MRLPDEKRPRIQRRTLVPVEKDAQAFVKNKCSDNAINISTKKEEIKVDIWFDKHYCHREQHGDADGKREGIDSGLVERIVAESAKELIYYSLKVKQFKFVNFTDSIRNERIIIQYQSDPSEEKLNIVVEYHYAGRFQIEATVKTAMRTDEFKLSDNQFVLEILEGHPSNLLKSEQRKIVHVSSFIE